MPSNVLRSTPGTQGELGGVEVDGALEDAVGECTVVGCGFGDRCLFG